MFQHVKQELEQFRNEPIQKTQLQLVWKLYQIDYDDNIGGVPGEAYLAPERKKILPANQVYCRTYESSDIYLHLQKQTPLKALSSKIQVEDASIQKKQATIVLKGLNTASNNVGASNEVITITNTTIFSECNLVFDIILLGHNF